MSLLQAVGGYLLFAIACILLLELLMPGVVGALFTVLWDRDR